ncbi:MAG: endopeptidase La [Spirochaetaceae bacterium]|nr:endopeptidase La [Spirochaetaceae bacterium]
MSDEIMPIDYVLPPKLPIIPLTGRPIFPGVLTPILIGNPPDVKLIEESASSSAIIGLVLARRDSRPETISDLYKVGTAAKIVKKINLPDGGLNIFITTLKRFKIKKTLRESDPMIAAVQYLEEESDSSSETKALTRALISEMKVISENNPLFSEEMRLNMVNIDHPGKIADFIVSILNIDRAKQQKVLEILNVKKRMEQVLIYIKKEQDIMRIKTRIQKEINDKIKKSQREYFLKEELKAIKKELGPSYEEEASEYDRLAEKLKGFNFEGEVKAAVDEELAKFASIDPRSPEFAITRNYLDWIAALPWDAPPPEEFNLKTAAAVLEKDHYGLKDVKARIVEHLAVRKLRKDSKGTIICLLGPPGVGKTSVGRSIARAMSKQFYRFSVGGIRDVAEIKGHRRTYIGALPGKIIQGLKTVKTKDPVFMLDEIDKMGAGVSGDPASALLEVLDPEQNVTFRDHYLDLPFDISRVFFILTANTLDGVPLPLIDRMEIIDIPGYIDSEKLEIARRYLLPKSLEKNGLKQSQVKYTKDAFLFIANSYAREAGVRNFEKNMDKIHRKLAKELVEKEETELPEKSKKTEASRKAEIQKFTVDKTLIETYLGKPFFPEGVFKKAEEEGTALGLAWTSMGGDVLVIEAASVAGKSGFTLTGKMGDVMKESAAIAMTVARKVVCEKYDVNPKWFERNHVHLHIPEGATPKDGPSAGVTMAVALISLFIKRAASQNLAMTGELSLTGKVLPIGGLKEKTIAAKRNKVKRVIIPKQNTRDLDEAPDYVKNGIEFHPVETFDEIIALAFPD